METKQVSWFSFDPDVHIEREQMCCYLTRTTGRTHQIIRDNLHETPTYGGWVEAKGPRYCPSIEDKIVRFQDKESHQIFVESEGRSVPELYVQAGLSRKAFILIQLCQLQKILLSLTKLISRFPWDWEDSNHTRASNYHFAFNSNKAAFEILLNRSGMFELKRGPQLQIEEKCKHWGLASPWLNSVNPRDSLMSKDGDDGFFPTTGNELYYLWSLTSRP